jgi:hypothetical protein
VGNGQAVLLFPAFHLLVASSPVQDLLLCAKHLFVEAMLEKNAAFRQRRAADMRAYRKRQNAGIALFYVAADETTYEMMKRFGGLDPNKVDDKQAVRAALGRLLRAGLKALLEREAAPLKNFS